MFLNFLHQWLIVLVFPEAFQKITQAEDDGHHSFSFDDRTGKISPYMYCLAATACFCVATKLFHTAPRIFSLGNAAKSTSYQEEEIADMESAILNTLKFRVNTPTPAKFLKEMLVLLFDDESSMCFTGLLDDKGVHVYLHRNACKLGTFLSTTWEPQNDTESRIFKQAAYLMDLVAYSSSYPMATSALPSKVALSAILEAVSDNIEGEEQMTFQDRLHGLSEINWAFDYDEEIREIRNCIRSILHMEGCRKEMRELGGVSPVTVLDFKVEPTSSPRKRDIASVENASQSKNVGNLSSCASVDSISCEVNHSSREQKQNHESFDDDDDYVWGSLEDPHSLAPSKHPSCFNPVDIFNDKKKKSAKTKAVKRVSEAA